LQEAGSLDRFTGSSKPRTSRSCGAACDSRWLMMMQLTNGQHAWCSRCCSKSAL